MANMREAVIQYLVEQERISDSSVVAEEKNWIHEQVIGAVKSLECAGYVTSTQTEKKKIVLTEEGKTYFRDGLPEASVYNLVKSKGKIAQAELKAEVGQIGAIGFAKAMQNKWIAIDKSTNVITPAVDSIVDEVKPQLGLVNDLGSDPATLAKSLDNKKLTELKRRKLVSEAAMTVVAVEKTANFSATGEKKVADITDEMLQNEKWDRDALKEYNFVACGADLEGGHLHPLLKVRAEFRKVLLHMGFEEMPTNRWVESSFWNFDTLFQPQQHPARDAHDTFFLTEPAKAQREEIPSEYFERVRNIHQCGGYGSLGWRYKWSVDESLKNILRTHTTAISARMLYKLGQDYQKTKVFKPRKFFSIDRVFRNETLDATHLAEFHQVEGFVADRNLNIGNLIGIFREFFRRIGITNLRFKPAYNPYTEPSMEIFGYHPLLDKWVEVGNSGVFRPEMLLPMGLPEEVTVIAWGLSLERPTMIQYGISNIRELFGHRMDLRKMKANPICWIQNSNSTTTLAVS